MTVVALSNGATVLVDDADADLVAGQWQSTGSYAIRKEGRHTVYLHRLLCGLERGDVRCVDHINGDTYDNRRSNLRVCSRSDNAQNQRAHGGSSRFRGVSLFRNGRWQAYAMLKGKQTHLGYYDDENEAARVAAEFRAAHMPFAVEAI